MPANSQRFPPRSRIRNSFRVGTLTGVLMLYGLACLLLAGGSAAGAQAKRRATASPTPKPIDWDKLTQEATDLLSKYIRINTTDPPGNELPAARMLREKFLADGIPATIWESSPGRAILAARLHGVGRHT